MAVPIIGTPLLYKNRTIYPAYQDDGSIFITYLATKTEAERIASSYGEQFVSTDGAVPPTKYFVSIGIYPKNSSNYGVFPPGKDRSILNGISNNDLSLAIKQDRNFYNTVSQVTIPATGPDGTTPATPGGPPVIPPGGTTPPTAPNPVQEGGSTPSPTQPEQSNPTGRGSSGLRYPLEMKPEQDKIKFQACKISRSSSSITSSPKYDPVDDPVALAIQSPISDQNSVDWGPDTVNAIDAAVFDLSLTAIKADNPFGQASQDEIKKAYGNLIKNSDRIRKYLAGQAASINNVLARTDGVVLNPNLELLFQGPQLRPFTFQFKMSARDKDEAKVIKAIIKYFKYHMAVKNERDLFLRAPHVFTIRYLKGENNPHPGINLISPTPDTKACALTNCSVDYTPLGSYMTFSDTGDPKADGTMVSYTLNLQFQEITPIYDTDYVTGPGSTHPIGY